MLELTIPTMYDPSLAPPGKHIMGIFLQYAPYTLREHHVGRGARAVLQPGGGSDRRVHTQYSFDHLSISRC